MLGQAGNRSFLIMSFFVYVWQSKKDSRLYVGFTIDLDKRIQEHNNGKTKSTKGFRPWVLVYKEIVETRELARSREKFLKSGIGKKIIKEYIQHMAS
jgi:putative endonuclease